MKLIIINAVSMTLAIGAIYLAANGVNGWGWFILALSAHFVTRKTLRANHVNRRTTHAPVCIQ